MDRNNLAASLAVCAALALGGCGGAGGDSGGGGNAVNNRQTAGAAANAAPGPDTVQTSPPASIGNATPAVDTSAPATAGGGGDKAKAANAPRPQIGSGGNDLFLFTQVRAALGADEGLRGADPVVEVKDGVLTLSGTVATPEQKARAEQVARGVAGVKDVRNQLRVSAGG